MLWRKAYETESVPVEGIELPIGLPDDCAFLMGPLNRWSEMMVWERLVAEKGSPVWFGIQADAAMAQAVIPRSRLDRVLLMDGVADEVLAVVIHDGQAVLAMRGKATESALDRFMEAMV